MTPSTSSLNSDRLRQWLTLISIVAAFVVNAASNIFPINDLTIGEIANTLFSDVKIIPANYAFAIWGLIYLGLFSFGIYQFQTAQRSNPKLRDIGYLVVLASLAQIVWVFVFLDRMFGRSLIAMIVILVALMGAYLQLKMGQMSFSQKERWFINAPISLYLGWISVATITNVALVLYDSGWSAWGITPQLWTVIMMGIAGMIGVWLRIQYQETAFPLVLIWAFVAIAVRQSHEPLIMGSAIIISVILSLIGLGSTIFRRFSTSSPE